MDETTTHQAIDPTTGPTPARPTLQQRVLGWRGVAAVALAGVILGGAGGAALGAMSNGADGTTRGPGGFGGPGRFGGTGTGMTGGTTGGVPGQLPPTTAPQQDEEGGHNT